MKITQSPGRRLAGSLAAGAAVAGTLVAWDDVIAMPRWSLRQRHRSRRACT